MLRTACTRVAALWEVWQVELHGKYSVERLHSLLAYTRGASHARALFVLLVTPLPCLFCIVVADLIPLEAPERGLRSSQMFWLRVFVAASTINFAALFQCRCLIPALPMKMIEIAAVAAITSASVVGTVLGLACAIGYPLPFTTSLGLPSNFVILFAASACAWGRHVVGHRDVQSDILAYARVVVVQVALAYVYPAYNYVFIGLSPTLQTLFAMLLPVMKMLVKNCLAHLVRSNEDFMPEMVTLNAEVFHALFVAYCMQSASSMSTTAVLMTVDFAQACLSLHDANVMLRALHVLIRDGDDDIRSDHTAIECRQQRLEQVTAIAKRTRVAPTLRASSIGTTSALHEPVSLVDVALLILSIDHELLKSHSSVRLLSTVRQTSKRACSQPVSHRIAVTPAPPHAACSTMTAPMDDTRDIATAVEQAAQPQRQRNSVISRASHAPPERAVQTRPIESPPTRLSADVQQRVRALSNAKRVAFVEQLLQLLHLIEFLLLVEFTEVIVPAIYCVYLGAIFYLPNRQYYSNLRDVDDATLRRNIANVTLYALLEVVSFVLLALMLGRKLRIPSLRHLAFVLTRQWPMVQSKLILWVVFTVQASLQHYGVDYSFQFKWLQRSPNEKP